MHKDIKDIDVELWAGIECTVNRVNDDYLDQLHCNGHRLRIEDLDRFAALGVRALRYPVLWETIAPDGPEGADWSWPDERLSRLRALGVRPIVGLVHHGSGPRHTSLVDPGFPEELARFARAVALRYPWLEDYTPVNEPLTTARFSGLYGHWYPHGRDEPTFARALVVQCRAVARAMQAIREVNPRARLVQTEDLGKTWSTPGMAYQAAFENERRWLSLDLLCGRVDEGHRMWGHLRWCGIEEAELRWFLENPCPPDILGINHYLTSERFLDERRERYPAHTHGGNGRDAYADVEAVRVVAEGAAGPQALLGEVWERYGRPIAVTEVHLGCTREEQMRWLLEVWRAARALRRETGADVRAVTAWSLLGAYDWNSLLTRCDGHYEPGVFDLRAPEPRPTALAGLLRDLAAGREPDHPALATPGWWRRPHRLLYPPVHAHEGSGTAVAAEAGETDAEVRPILITGGEGALADVFARLCAERGLVCRRVCEAGEIEETLRGLRPWAVVDAAGGAATPALAAACARHGARLLAFSAARVFAGRKNAPYAESDPPSPGCARGRADAERESRLAQFPGTLIVRTSAVFGLGDRNDFVFHGLRALAAGRSFAEAEDRRITPVYVLDLVHACLDLLIDGESGLWHLAHPGPLAIATPLEILRRAAALAGLDASGLQGRRARAGGDETRGDETRGDEMLASERGVLLPSLESALAHYAGELRRTWTERTPARPARRRAAAAGHR